MYMNNIEKVIRVSKKMGVLISIAGTIVGTVVLILEQVIEYQKI